MVSHHSQIIDYFIMDKINHRSLLHEHYFSLPAMIIHHAISNKKCLEDQHSWNKWKCIFVEVSNIAMVLLLIIIMAFLYPAPL